MRLSIFEYMHQAGIRRIRLRNSTATMMRKGSDQWELMPLENNPVYGPLLLSDLLLGQMGHEEMVIYYEPVEGAECMLKAVLAIYSRDLGPAVTGIRVNTYDTEEDMVEDALMISRTMSRKAAYANLPLGGGHIAVDWPRPMDFSSNRPAIFPYLEHLGRLIDEYEGRVIGAPDMHTHMHTMHIIQRTTSHVICNMGVDQYIKVENGLEEPGSIHGSGDPSSFAAYSCFRAMETGWRFRQGDQDASLAGTRVLVLGLGRTGLALVDLLLKSGAEVMGADVDPAACEIMEDVYQVKIVARTREEIMQAHATPCDILAPCAIGQLISDKRIREFDTKLICGVANHQLNQDKDANLLHERGILWIPDICSNVGGLINAAQEVRFDKNGQRKYRSGYDRDAVYQSIDRLESELWDHLKFAERHSLTPYEVCIARSDLRMQGQRKERWLKAFQRQG